MLLITNGQLLWREREHDADNDEIDFNEEIGDYYKVDYEPFDDFVDDVRCCAGGGIYYAIGNNVYNGAVSVCDLIMLK